MNREERQKYLRDNIQYKEISLLDKGWLVLDDWMKDDFDIVRHARESTTADLKGDEKDLGLLEYLIKNGHVSPFEMPVICFRAYMPIFNFRQLVRHKSLSVNELSGRYVKEMPDDVYCPSEWRLQDIKNKQSSFTDESINKVISFNSINSLYRSNIDKSKEVEKSLRKAGIANELARLPNSVAQYTRVSLSGTLRDWLWGVLRQRLHPHAQWELRVYAYAIAAFIKELYPYTWNLFVKYVIGNLDITLDDYNYATVGSETTLFDFVQKKVNQSQLYINSINNNINELVYWNNDGNKNQ